MKTFITICMLLLSCQWASAQHDLYKWRLNGYTGIANYLNEDNSTSDYFKTNQNLLYRVELTRNIGNSVGLSASYTFGEVRGRDQLRNAFNTDVRMSSLRAYFYTDNGWLLNSSALIAPYFFGGYGLSILETSNGSTTEESRYVPAIPFGLGIKFRIAERWQLALQTEAVYLTESHLEGPALEQNDHNSAYIHTGLTLGYSFGFKESTFKAPRFYAANIAMLESVERQDQPKQNVLEMMLQLPPKQVQVISPPGAANVTPKVITKRTVVSPADTLSANDRTNLRADSSSSYAQIMRHRLVPVEPKQTRDSITNSLKTISSARTMIRLDSVVGNNEVQPGPVVRERTVVIRDESQPAAAVQERAVSVDTVITRQRAATRQQQEERRVQRTATPERAPASTREAAPVRTSETARVIERNVYVPSETRPASVQSTVGADTELLREEQLRLNILNAEISRIQGRIDSLQTVQRTDTIRMIGKPATDTSMVQYLQQQAALNDSVLQRLNQYEQEIARLKKANAAPVSAPIATAPKAYGTTVFYPINAHQVPAESLRDLNQVLKTLQENPDMQVKLTGYTSQSGNAAYNMALSRKRVQSLENFLTDQGIAAQRISTEYLGDEKSSQKENPLDRKVEVQIIE